MFAPTFLQRPNSKAGAADTKGCTGSSQGAEGFFSQEDHGDTVGLDDLKVLLQPQ